MRQITNCDFPDTWAENWERFVQAEAWCFKWCDYFKVCPVQGEPHTKDCQLRADEENSR